MSRKVCEAGRGHGHTGHYRSKTYGDVPGGMSYREIGAVLGMSHTHVKLIEQKALRKLRIRLQAIAEEADCDFVLP